MAARKAARKKSAARAPTKRKSSAARPGRKLTTRQSRFVDEYAIDANATQAAIRAGYTEKTAYAVGSHLLKNVKVAAAVAANEQARSERLRYTADEALRDLIPLCKTNIKNYIVDGKLAGVAEIGELPDDIAACITGIETTEKFDQFGNPIIETKFKLHDRVKAVTQAGRHRAVQAWTETVEHNHTFGERMDAIRERLGGDS